MTKAYFSGNTFVSREKEIIKLTKHLDWVKNNNKVRLVFIHGEAGSGKTTLLKYFLSTIPKKEKVITGWGNCSLERQGNGLTPFAQLLDDVNKQVTNWKIVGKNYAEFIGKVAPAWLNLVTFGLAAPATTTIEESAKLVKSQKVSFSLENVYIQFTNAIDQQTKKRLTVFVIEDLHWADKSSLELLFHLVRNLDDCSLLILATFRTVDAMHSSEYSSDFKTIYANLIKDSNKTQEIILEDGLSAREYIQSRFNPLILDDEIITQIQNATGGHAIYIAELFNLWQERGDIVYDGKTWGLAKTEIAIEIPSSFREVLHQRINNLNEQLREIITRASVEGDDFTVQTIAKLLEIEEYKMFDEIESLEKNYHLVSEGGSQEISKIIFDFYHFAHRFIQQHIYEELSEGKRRLLHRQLGLCLEELCSDKEQVAAQLAHHFYKAGLFDKAIPYAIQASHHEQSRYMWNEAYRWISLAADWIAQTSPSDESNLFRFQIKAILGDNFFYQGKYAEAEKYYREALDFYSSNKLKISPDYIGKMYYNLSVLFDELARFDDGLKVTHEGKLFLEENGVTFGEVYFDLEISKNLLLGRLGKHNLAQQGIENLIKNIESQPTIDFLNKNLASAYHIQGIIFSYMGDFKNSIPSYLKAIELFSSLDYLVLQSFTIGALTEDFISTGDFEKAKSWSLKGLEMSRRIGDISGESYGLYTQGQILLELGHPKNAIENFEQAIRLAERIGSIAYYYFSDSALAYLKIDENLALEYANKGLQLAGNTQYEKGHALMILGIVESEKHDWNKAIEHFNLATKFMEEIGDKYELATTHKHYGKTLKKMGEINKAESLLNESIRIFRDLGIFHEVDSVNSILES